MFDFPKQAQEGQVLAWQNGRWRPATMPTAVFYTTLTANTNVVLSDTTQSGVVSPIGEGSALYFIDDVWKSKFAIKNEGLSLQFYTKNDQDAWRVVSLIDVNDGSTYFYGAKVEIRSNLVITDASGTVSTTISMVNGNCSIAAQNKVHINALMSDQRTITTSNDTGTVGEICWDDTYVYICYATDSWKRVELAVW